MCGRYASARKRQELLAEFQIERDRVSDELPPDYNVAPTKPVYAVLTRGKPGRSEQEDQAARELRVVRWGLVPSWAKDMSIGNRLINARAETVDSKPAFRKAFARRRCLLPADGFYEWQESLAGGRARKQPFYIHRADGGVLAFAGLYEIWRDASFPEDHPKAWLWSATIITTEARDEVGRIHDRMPMVIAPGRWDDWLDPDIADAAHLRTLLAPAVSAVALDSYPVSTDVNSVRNNGPRLIERVAPPGPGGDSDRNGPAGDAAARSTRGRRVASDGPAAESAPEAGGRPHPGQDAQARPRGQAPPPGQAPPGQARNPGQVPHPQEQARDPLTLF